MRTEEREDIEARMTAAQARYGNFASTHEALGVALEEWYELVDAVRANAPDQIRDECLDLAAVMIRLSEQIDTSDELRARSRK